MKKIIILIFVILIPIVAAVLFGWYATDMYYNPETNTAAASSFRSYINKGIITSPGRIEKYRKFENYFYQEDPLLFEEVKNEAGEKMMTVAIYRNAYYYQPSSDVEKTLKIKLEFFVYDINYELIREYFIVDDKTVIQNAPLPTLTMEVIPTNGKTSFTVSLTTRSDQMILDYQSTPEYADLESETKNYVQGGIVREAQQTELAKFSDDANIKITASTTITNDDASTTTLNADNDIANLYVKDFKTDYDEIDSSVWVEGQRDASVYNTFMNAGYFGWLFGHYLWWECLITFIIFGIVTSLFYIVWTSEDDKSKPKAKSKK